MTLQLLPQEFYDHLKAGNMVVLTATPLNKPIKPISIAFDLKHLYDHTVLPQGSWVAEKPMADLPPGATPEAAVEACLHSIMKMADKINAVVMIDFDMAMPKNVAYN